MIRLHLRRLPAARRLIVCVRACVLMCAKQPRKISVEWYGNIVCARQIGVVTAFKANLFAPKPELCLTRWRHAMANLLSHGHKKALSHAETRVCKQYDKSTCKPIKLKKSYFKWMRWSDMGASASLTIVSSACVCTWRSIFTLFFIYFPFRFDRTYNVSHFYSFIYLLFFRVSLLLNLPNCISAEFGLVRQFFFNISLPPSLSFIRFRMALMRIRYTRIIVQCVHPLHDSMHFDHEEPAGACLTWHVGSADWLPGWLAALLAALMCCYRFVILRYVCSTNRERDRLIQTYCRNSALKCLACA